jgi:phosphonate transport system substrate-binding protein
MLIDGAVDAIVGWALVPADADAELHGGTIERLVGAGMERGALSVVWRSPTLRYGPHVLRAGMDPEVKLLLTGFLIALKARQPDLYALVERSHGGGFAAVTAADYEVAVDAVSRTVASK